MKIALFGGTGPTGRYIIEEALRKGYKLSVYTRGAGKLSAFGDRIEVIVGDLNNREAIKACVTGADAVISALGPNKQKAQEKRPVMRGVRTIISVMEELSVRRLIQISTASYRDPKDGFDLRSRGLATMFKLLAHNAYDDIKATAELVSNSHLDWSLVRIPFLKDGPATAQVDVGWYGRTKLGMKLSRGNLAKFLVGQVTAKEFVRAAPGIADRS
ncbi:putative NADH-flavin reductase [Rhizobium mesoamericanum]|uniref:NAD(P)-dependent oxidoreductase n=1 Tax=Rhizobium mesoamericanum TaxID=1079800 RepID=UPI002784EC2D|nr:SDR family oxidoreductase [Rhizobium mesoamericanum]MDQ0561901.1 putative NADH-flavin reductase [Rhizobium mesoamericanum]